MESENLQAIFANASTAMAVLRGSSLIYEKINRSYANLFHDRKIEGKTLLEALPELQGQKFPDYLSEVFLNGKPYHETEAHAFLRRTPEGPLEERYFDQSYTRMLDAKGNPYGVLIQAIDVTERVLSRRVLAESEARFRIAIELAKMGTWDLDPQTGDVKFSERTNLLFGFQPHDHFPLPEILKRIHPEDRPRVEAAVAAAMDPAGDGDGNYTIQYRTVWTDQSIHWVSVLGKAFFSNTPNGRIATRFSGTVIDVTEKIQTENALRKSEKQFKMIAELMPQVVWTANPEGILDYTNGRWTQYSGSDRPELWHTFVHPDDAAHVFKVWADCVATGKIYEAEFRLLRKSDQSYRWFLVRADPTFGPDGKLERWIGTCTDIDEQKKAITLRSEFMSVASHELKTPLTSLKLQTQSMLRNYKRGKLEAFSIERVGSLLANNEKQVERLIKLVDDMLDFAKIESGKLTVSREHTAVCTLVKEVYEQLKEQLETAGCSTSFRCDETVYAEVDRFRIEQVATNLLTNALKYGREKPVEISVAKSVRNNLPTVLISVRDQGIGIAPENKQRIFNRFERAVSPSEVSGLGLGLFITHQIVEAHHGKIWVESELGKGSTFFVELPVQTSEATKTDQA